MKAVAVKDWAQALSVFRQDPGTPSPVNYNAMLHAADACDRQEEASQLYSEMCRVGHPQSAATFTPLMNLLARRGRVAEVKHLLKEMGARRIDPTPHVSCILVKAHGRAGDLEGALQVWRDMQAAGVALSSRSLLAILTVLAHGGDLARVEALMREAAEQVPLGTAHSNCALKACVRAHNADAALRILREMREAGIARDVISYTSVLMALLRGGRPAADVEAVVQAMRVDGIARDRFFTEVYLAALLRMDLQAVTAEALGRCPPEALRQAAAAAAEAAAAGQDLTRLAKQAVALLQQALAAAAAPTPGGDWAKVVGGPEAYYWDRATGLTQWDPPAGHSALPVVAAAGAAA